MAERKQTPDVLAELLSAELPPAAAAPAAVPEVRAPAAAPRTHKAADKTQPPREPQPRPQPNREPVPQTWEVEIVTFQEHRGWRPRFVNGTEIKDWLDGSTVQDYVNLRGNEGWELAASTNRDRFYGAADGLQLYFKRRK
jgi:hypothetical protein